MLLVSFVNSYTDIYNFRNLISVLRNILCTCSALIFNNKARQDTFGICIHNIDDTALN